MHGLTSVLLCVAFIFADSTRYLFAVVLHDGFPRNRPSFHCDWINYRGPSLFVVLCNVENKCHFAVSVIDSWKYKVVKQPKPEDMLVDI